LIAEARLPIADLLFDNSITFDPANRMFYADACTGKAMILHFGRVREFLSPRLFLGLHNHQRRVAKTLKPSILIHVTPGGEMIVRFIRYPFIMFLPFTGAAEKNDPTFSVDDDIILDGVALFLPL